MKCDFLKPILITILLFIINGQSLLSQNFDVSNYIKINFKIEDGLPSNECHDIVQDSQGYIWIATDRGLVRYDGYGFKKYDGLNGLSNISCLELQLGFNNDIWIMTYGGQLYQYLNNGDTIIQYKYNHIIKSINGDRNFTEFHVTENGIIYCMISSLGVLKINSNGENEIMKKPCEEIDSYVFEENEFQALVSITDGPPGKFCFRLKKYESFDNSSKSIGHPYIYNFNGGKSVLTRMGYRYFFEGDSMSYYTQGQELQDLIEIGGHIVTGQLYGLGIKSFESFDKLKENEFSQILPDVSVTSLLEDLQGNLFVATLNNGIFYFMKNEQFKKLSSDQSVNSLEHVADSLIYFIKENTSIAYINTNTLHSDILSKGKSYFDIKLIDDDLLIMSHPCNEVWKRNSCPTINSYCERQIIKSIGKRAVKTKDKVWIIGPNQFYLYNHQSAYEESISFPYSIETISEYKDSLFLIGGNDGLFEFDLVNVVSLKQLHPVFSTRINDIVYHKGKYFIGSLGNGIIVWDGLKYFDKIDFNDGLVSNNIESLHTHNDKLYACTFSGLSVINYSNPQDIDILNYDRRNGLPSDQIYDLAFQGNQIFAATGKGVISIDNISRDEYCYPVIIENLLVNNQLVKQGDPNKFTYKRNNIALSYKALDLKRMGQISYKYKLNAEWIHTNKTDINFANLAPGEYTFQIRTTNNLGKEGEISTISWLILSPWWKSSIFYLFCLTSTIALSFAAYKRRALKLILAASVQQEIRDLEKAALQAQMNSHFIFNCLNSIQNFIMKNKKEEAMEYLSRFSQLVRSALNASTKSNIPLCEEIQYLDHYLTLEQLRHDYLFVFKIDCDSNVDILNTKIPPMLIQPFVENAVIHGMSKKLENGKIQIHFSLELDKLKVQVLDNGSKISSANSSHNSLGSQITRKRLSFINKTSPENISIEPKITDQGTLVTILINIVDL